MSKTKLPQVNSVFDQKPQIFLSFYVTLRYTHLFEIYPNNYRLYYVIFYYRYVNLCHHIIIKFLHKLYYMYFKGYIML